MTSDEQSRPVTEASAPWSDRAHEMLNGWHLRATAAQFGHQTKAQRSRRLNLLLGIPVVGLTTIVGTSVFAALSETPTREAKLLAGTVTILAAVLSAIQTFLAYAQVTENHRVAASRYSTARRHIELAIAREDANAIDRIRAEMDKAGAGSDPIGDKLWKSSLSTARGQIAASRRDEIGIVSSDDEA